MNTRIYIVQGPNEAKPRMVEASSQAAAIGYVIRGSYTAKVANAMTVHELTSNGTKLEKAGGE